ncbi:MAG: tyrosine-type recombinase/integrase [Bilophila wadsworthia]
MRPYDLRHAFASLALVYGADIKCVAETMGHKNITMLLSVYQHTLFEQRRRAVNAAPGLFSGTGAKRGKKKRLPPGRGKEASAFFEPAWSAGGASARRGGLMGRCRLRLRWNPRGGQDGCRDSGRTAAGRKRGGMSGDSRRGGRFGALPRLPEGLLMPGKLAAAGAAWG